MLAELSCGQGIPRFEARFCDSLTPEDVMDKNKKLEIIKQNVFEYVVVKHPTVEEAEAGKGSEIVVPLTQVCANDDRAATLRANRAIPEDHMNNEARLEVVVRPF